MRAIKYEMFSAFHKEMLTVTSLELHESGDVVARHDDDNRRFGALVSHPSSGVFLREYTGLKDKNGIEIYEGDVIKLSRYWNDEYDVEISSVYFVLGCFRFAHKLVNKSDELCIIANESKVIGNIHENPELIKIK